MKTRTWKNPGSDRWDEDLVVTPEIAAYWLERISSRQAKVRQNLVDRYAEMRRAGMWDENNDSPIKIDVLGEVIDGKHRLWMVVETGMPTRFHIHYNVPTAVYDTTDTGRLRGLDDVAYGPFHGDKRAAAISKAMVSVSPNGSGNIAAANLPLMRVFQERHEDAITFATGLFKKTKRGLSAPVMAAVARAFYYVPRHELALFVDRLYTGVIADEGEVAVVRLRDWLGYENTAVRTKFTKRPGRGEVYLKTARAIELFVSRTPVQRLFAATADPFPLPED